MAAGLEVATEDRDVLADVLQVFGGDSGLHWAVLAPRLDAQFPDRWSETTAEAGVGRMPRPRRPERRCEDVRPGAQGLPPGRRRARRRQAMRPLPGRGSATARDQSECRLRRPAATARLRGRGSRRPSGTATTGGPWVEVRPA